jgi:hypothetical protein
MKPSLDLRQKVLTPPRGDRTIREVAASFCVGTGAGSMPRTAGVEDTEQA